jgi:hypothetical protein
MTNLLEFALNKYIGPPDKYHCPQCQTKTRYRIVTTDKDRFRCTSCGKGGDLPDLIRQVHPTEPWDRRMDIIEALEREYKEWQSANLSSSQEPGIGDGGGVEAAMKEFTTYTESLFKDVDDTEVVTKSLRTAAKALEFCVTHEVHPLDMMLGIEAMLIVSGTDFH